jgi:hypothetical protein
MNNPEKIKSLVKSFVEGVVKHRENMFTNHVLANQYFDQYLNALKELTSFGLSGLEVLSELLNNPRPIVRVTTAMYLISFYPDRVIPILQAELNEKSPLSPEALVTLEKWKRGRFLDPLTGKEMKLEDGRKN